MTKIVTRLAPSPTGFAHAGTMRTALFNWLYARHHGGQFFLRIEDTDKARNVEEAIQPIINGLAWLGIHPDGDIVYQSQRAERHVEVANQLLNSGAAYRCYMSDDEVTAQKTINRKTGAAFRSVWRDRNASDKGEPFTVRLRAPDSGTITINDLVQGEVTVSTDTIDDMVLLRADGTPVYMLAVVVDDYDAGISHVLRGDDHLSNAFRQLGIYRAMGWAEPAYGHIPLIHDESGKKLSKRHGAAGLDFYKDAGFLPDAVFNYLLRMGWGHGDHEIFSVEQAIELFDIDGVGKAPARLDMKRLEHLNGIYIRDMDMGAFGAALTDFMADDDTPQHFIEAMVALVKERSKTLREAADYIVMAWRGPSALTVDDSIVPDFLSRVGDADWNAETLKATAEQIATERETKLKHVVAPIRMAIMGNKVSPPLFETMVVLGRDVTLGRLGS